MTKNQSKIIKHAVRIRIVCIPVRLSEVSKYYQTVRSVAFGRRLVEICSYLQSLLQEGFVKISLIDLTQQLLTA